MLKQEWKPGRLKKDKLFVSNSLRDLYVDEVAFLKRVEARLRTNEAYREEMIGRLFPTDPEFMKRHLAKEHSKWMFGEGRGVKEAPRRYWAQPQILGWDIFWAVEDAESAGKMGSWEDYLNFLKNEISDPVLPLLFAAKMAIQLLDPVEVVGLINDREFQPWLNSVIFFYAKSFFWIPFSGRHKEILCVSSLKEAVSLYEGLRLLPTSEVHDVKYMFDYVILRAHDRQPILGVSIKGESYARGGRSSHKAAGESRESRGHREFKKDFGSQVETVTVIASGKPSDDESYINSVRNPVSLALGKLEKSFGLRRVISFW